MVENGLTEVFLFGPDEILFQRSILGFGQSGVRISTAMINAPEDVDVALEIFRPHVAATVDGICGFDALPQMTLVRDRHPVLPIFVVADHPAPGRVLRLMRAGADEVFCFSETDRLAHFLSAIGRSQIRPRAITRFLQSGSQQISQALPDNLFDGVIVLSPDGRCREINAAATKWLEIPHQDIIGRNIYGFMGPRTAERWQAFVKQVVETGKRVEVEEDEDGNWLRGRLIPLADRSGEVAEILVIAADVTDVRRRERVEENLRQSEERYRTLCEQSPDAVVVHRNWAILYANGTAARFFGFTDTQDLIGRDLRAFISPGHRDRAFQRISAMAEMGRFRSPVRFHFKKQDGTTVVGSVTGGIIDFDSEEAIQSVIRDVSRLSGIENRNYLLTQAVEQSPVGIALAAENGSLLYTNTEFRRQFGVECGAGTELSIEDFNHIEPNHGSAADILETLRAGKPWTINGRYTRPDGEVLCCTADVTPVWNANKDLSGFLCVIRDTTSQRRTEARLEQAQRMESLGQLTSGVAHDFNNILAVILTNAEMLVEDVQGNAFLEGIIASIIRAVQRGASLSGRLLEFSRPGQNASPQPLEVFHWVHEMQDVLQRSLGDEVTVSVTVPDDLPMIVVDLPQLENALLNLALNARDAMVAGGRLSIEVSEKPIPDKYEGARDATKEHVCIAVADTGHGIPPDLIDKIFEPLFSTKKRGNGTGLGLSMVYAFVKQSGGEIFVTSTEGQGTTFEMYFPRSDSEEDLPSKAEIPHSDQDKRAAGGLIAPLKILLAEDDNDVRTATAYSLRSMGHEVVEVSDGDAVMDWIQTDPEIDLLFSDVVMRGTLSGKELAAAVRSVKPDLPFIFASGYSASHVSEDELARHGILFLAKPFQAEDIEEALRNLFPDPSHQ